MAQWTHIQRSFSGGIISPKMWMRADTEVYKQSAASMINFLPTAQGSAIRMPGTQYLQEIPSLDARIIPYLTSANERALLVFTPLAVNQYRNIADRLEEGAFGMPPDPTPGTITYRKQVIPNYDFKKSLDGWSVDPNEYYSSNGEGPLGVFFGGQNMIMSPRIYKKGDIAVCTAETTATVDVATDAVSIDFDIEYFANPDVGSGGFSFVVEVASDAAYSNVIFSKTYGHATYPVAGASFSLGMQNASLPTTAWTGTLYVRLTATALTTTEREFSNPQFRVKYVSMLANGEAVVTDEPLVTPYTADDLPDLHFVQSPYDDKELVVTHPRHPPYKFYFDTGGGAYTFAAIAFSNTPTSWGINTYPATCTSIQSRLVLGGGQTFKTASGDPVATVSETIWATESGNWTTFSLNPTNPADSLEFTTIYRSPIQWAYGQKDLMLGSLEYEYSVHTDSGLLQAGDLQVKVNSTSGSNNVQPAGFGEGVMFPGDAGKKLRFLRYRDESKGWLAEDMTLYYPEACFPGIRRMVRVRNPHQMCWVLRTDGEVAIFSSESGVEGWSRFRTNGGMIRDIAVTSDTDGRDVVWLTVERTIDGTKKLYLEAVAPHAYERAYGYNDCHVSFNFETPTNIITGLDHLEGKVVQVSSTARFLGFFTVVGGQITILDGTGAATNLTHAVVGMMHRCELYTLPPETQDPGAHKRYSEFAVRVIGSTVPIVNDLRPPDRRPQTVHNLSEPLDYINDIEVATTGWNPYQLIYIAEQIPFRTEILGVYGKLKVNGI